MHRNCRNSAIGQVITPKFDIPVGCFLFEYEFWWHFATIYGCFERKMAFVMQNFGIWGLVGGG